VGPFIFASVNSMKSRDKNKWIVLLMIISEIMITGFTIYWLAGQFQKERDNLTNSLYGYYKESYNVAVDSLLIDYIIEPALGNTKVLYSNRNNRGKIMRTDSVTLFTAIQNSDSLGTEGDNLVRLKINGQLDSVKKEAKYKFINSADSVLLRSIRLIIDKSSDSSTYTESFISKIGSGPDSVFFINDYEARLKQNNLNFDPVWIKPESTSVNSRAIVLEDWTGSLPSAVIHKPGLYLAGKILPQIIFSFILVLVSSFAFVLAYYSIRKQVRLNDMRNSFISNISHELKTPVSTVKVAIEALKKYDAEKRGPWDTAEYLEMAGKEIKRLELLISKVLDHSIIEEDAGILSFEELDLVRLIDDAIRSLQSRIETAGAIISYDHPDELIVSGDPLYLQGVIINLFDNSLKYGNGSPEISVLLSSTDRYAVINVTDNGPGIPDEYRKKIFDKFFRVPERDIHNVKGYGLGLSFAYLIVKMHEGSIDVRNNDKGCTFTIKIPFKQD